MRGFCFYAIALISILSGCLEGSLKAEIRTRQIVELTVLQLNTWMQASMVEGGLEGLAEQILHVDPDIVILCELQDSSFVKAITDALAAKGENFHGVSDAMPGARGVLSKYEISESYNVNRHILKAVVRIGGQRVAVYSAHLNYIY